jgi:hypothetical protein
MEREVNSIIDAEQLKTFQGGLISVKDKLGALRRPHHRLWGYLSLPLARDRGFRHETGRPVTLHTVCILQLSQFDESLA